MNKISKALSNEKSRGAQKQAVFTSRSLMMEEQRAAQVSRLEDQESTKPSRRLKNIFAKEDVLTS